MTHPININLRKPHQFFLTGALVGLGSSALYFLVGLFFWCIWLANSLHGEIFYRPGTSFRALAVGNTGISSAHDNEALFYNPATLANIQESYFDVLSIQYTSPLPISQTEKSFKLINNPEAEDYKVLFEQKQETNKIGGSAMSSLAIQFVDRGWTLGAAYLFDSNVYYTFDTAADENTDQTNNEKMDSKVFFDEVKTVGATMPFGFGSFVIGISAKNVKRSRSRRSYTEEDQQNDIDPPNKDDGSNGESWAGDFGLMYRKPGDVRLRVAFSALNAAGLKFGNTDLDEEPEYNVGISISPTIGVWRTLIALDYRDIGQNKGVVNGQKDTNAIKRTHFGIELGYYIRTKTYALLNLRAGLNQGLPTGGVELNFLFGRTIVIGYTYAQEDITDPGTSKKTLGYSVYYLSVGL